jgi:hypothetical protein
MIIMNKKEWINIVVNSYDKKKYSKEKMIEYWKDKDMKDWIPQLRNKTIRLGLPNIVK